MKVLTLFLTSALIALPTGSSNAQAPAQSMEQSEAAYQSGNFSQARTILVPLAQAGDALAQFRLGQMIATGTGGPVNLAEAMTLLEASFAQGRPEAGRLLADLGFQAATSEDDYQRVFAILTALGPELGSNGHLLLGKIYLDGLTGQGNAAAAFAHFSAAASDGDPEALTVLASFYETGYAVPANINAAISVLERAGNAGHDPAWLKLAQMLSKDDAPYFDKVRAVEIYEQLANDDSIVAKRKLGQFLVRDLTNKEDVARAIDWFNKAAEGGDPISLYNLGIAHLNGIGGEVDEEKAFQRLLAAGQRGHMASKVTLASMYQAGRGTERDVNEAIRWFLPAAQAGNADATRRLGEIALTARAEGMELEFAEAAIYVRGLFDQGVSDALSWLEVNAEAGDHEALLQLADIKLNSDQHETEFATGITMLQQAAEAGSTLAQSRLAARLSSGDGVEQSYVEAYRWANIAGASGNADAVQLRDTIIKLMTPVQIAKAQRLSRDYLLNAGAKTQ
ncbi:MAG: tetratricopeptide repeat protein [Pseudomonadota bacterium]